MGRGKVPLVRCANCGRMVRRDKAVSLDKVMFANPLDRNEVYDENYVRTFSRKVYYCPSCAKHLRIYEKKKKMAERRRERRMNMSMGFRKPREHHFQRRAPRAAEEQKATEKNEEKVAEEQKTTKENAEKEEQKETK